MICNLSAPVELTEGDVEYSRLECVLPAFSQGDLVISFLLFVLIVGGFSYFIFSRFFGVRISKSRQ